MSHSCAPAGSPRAPRDLIGQIRKGKNDYLSDGVRRALSREPTSFAEYAKNAVANGAWQG